MVWGITKTPIDFGPSFVGALDALAASAGAWSPARRLLTSYEGSLIRVRRSSDSTELDIGYDAAGDLDTAALLAFCGAGDGFVKTCYDQSGNARHQTNATAANQPRIVSAGVLDVDGANLRPAMIFDGVNDALWATVAVLQEWQWSVVAKFTAGSSVVVLSYDNLAQDLRSTTALFGAVSVGAFTYTSLSALSVRRKSGDSEAWKNGVSAGTSASTLAATAEARLYIGSRQGLDLWTRCTVAEVIMFPAVLSAGDRAALETNQIDYYGIS